MCDRVVGEGDDRPCHERVWIRTVPVTPRSTRPPAPPGPVGERGPVAARVGVCGGMRGEGVPGLGRLAVRGGVGALIQRGGRAVAGMLTIATAGGS